MSAHLVPTAGSLPPFPMGKYQYVLEDRWFCVLEKKREIQMDMGHLAVPRKQEQLIGYQRVKRRAAVQSTFRWQSSDHLNIEKKEDEEEREKIRFINITLMKGCKFVTLKEKPI